MRSCKNIILNEKRKRDNKLYGWFYNIEIKIIWWGTFSNKKMMKNKWDYSKGKLMQIYWDE